MGLAQHARLPVVVVGDIDRGGVFASMFGTVALLDAADQRLIAGSWSTSSAATSSLLQPGHRHARRGSPGGRCWACCRGCTSSGWTPRTRSTSPAGDGSTGRADSLRVAVVRFPRICNFTDLDALGARADVDVSSSPPTRRSATPTSSSCPAPGPPSPTWPGCARAAWPTPWSARAAAGRPVLGICGGYQMLGGAISDPDRSRGRRRARRARACCRVATDVRGRRRCCARPAPTAYEIHHGVVTVTGDATSLPGRLPRAASSGAPSGTASSTTTPPGTRSSARSPGLPANPRPTVRFRSPALREARLDRLADMIEEYADTTALMRLIEKGPPPVPFVPPGAP